MQNPYLRALGLIALVALGIAVVFAAIGFAVFLPGTGDANPYFIVALVALAAAGLATLFWLSVRAIGFALIQADRVSPAEDV